MVSENKVYWESFVRDSLDGVSAGVVWLAMRLRIVMSAERPSTNSLRPAA